MTEIKKINAAANFVVLRMVVKQGASELYKKDKSGLFLPNEETPQNAGNSKIELDYALVYDIGPEVKNDSFKVGDKVVFNEYDIKYVGSTENMFGIVKESSIMAVYETL